MVSALGFNANIHYPDGTVDQDQALYELPAVGQMIEGRGRHWRIVEVRLANLDESDQGTLHDVWVQPADARD